MNWYLGMSLVVFIAIFVLMAWKRPQEFEHEPEKFCLGMAIISATWIVTIPVIFVWMFVLEPVCRRVVKRVLK